MPGAPARTIDKEADNDNDDQEFPLVETDVAPHHDLILEAVDRCVARESGRLMLFMPPGSAKSTYASVVAPSYLMGKHAGIKLILATYNKTLATKMGRRTRAIARQAKFMALFNTAISRDSSAAHEWALQNGSEYMAGGILSGITGNRAHGIFIDDPIKGRRDADSEAVRKSTKDAYDEDIMTRLIPGGFVVLIQTRWHEDDLAGSILPIGYNGESGMIECRDGQMWEVINIPAQAERADDPLGRAVGTYIWPEWFPESHWAPFKKKPRTWASLFQQRPAPEEGDLFKVEWLRPYNKAPARETLTIYGGSDYAVTDDGGDYTVHIVIGMDPAGRLWVLDLWRQQTSSDRWVDVFCDMVLKWRPMAWAEETGQIKASVGPFLTAHMRKRGAYVVREQFPTRGDKAVRSQSIRGRMALDGLYVPAEASWYESFRSELLTFPTGRNDDQVDALGLVGQLLDKMFSQDVEEDEVPTKRDDYARRDQHDDPGDWKTF